jgi:hypothetical protein
MGEHPRAERASWRLWAACAFSIVLIAGSYVITRGIAKPPHAEASEEEALLQAIASRDSDADGLADWAESLYGTDPHVRDTFGHGMTDGEAVARGLIVPEAVADVPGADISGTAVDPDLPSAPEDDTLTAVFARNLFMRYMDALDRTGGNLSDEDLSSIANDALADIAGSVTPAPPFKSARDLAVGGSGGAAMVAFAAGVERVLLTNTASATTSEIYYLKDVVENGDLSALDRIVSIAKVYKASAAGIAALSSPRELADEHLALVNALARMSAVTSDLARVESDPLITMIALQQYPQAVLDLGTAFIDIANEFKTAGVTLSPGKPGAAVVNLVNDIAVDQQAGKNLPGKRETQAP